MSTTMFSTPAVPRDILRRARFTDLVPRQPGARR